MHVLFCSMNFVRHARHVVLFRLRAVKHHAGRHRSEYEITNKPVYRCVARPTSKASTRSRVAPVTLTGQSNHSPLRSALTVFRSGNSDATSIWRERRDNTNTTRISVRKLADAHSLSDRVEPRGPNTRAQRRFSLSKNVT